MRPPAPPNAPFLRWLKDRVAGRRVCIWGFGREGESSWHWLREAGSAADIQVCAPTREGLPAECPFLSQDALPQAAHAFDIILKSPGISLLATGVPRAVAERVTSQVAWTLEGAPHRLIAVTGTKGKSTTASLIAHAMNAAGTPARLAGNIGLPSWDAVCQVDPPETLILETSSFQLEHVRASPSIAVFLNLFCEHLNHHGSLEAYGDAKANIFTHQQAGDTLIARFGVPLLDDLLARRLAAIEGRRVWRFGPNRNDETLHAWAGAESLWIHTEIDAPEPFMSLHQRGALHGRHHVEHVLAAALALRAAGVSLKTFGQAVATFTPLPHRLTCVADIRGARFYNDSISTVPEAAIAALDAFPDAATLIVGGQDRGVPFDALAERIASGALDHVILLPDTGARIGDLLRAQTSAASHVNLHHVSTVNEAATLAVKLTEPGRACLFSPAAPSYHQFRNFEERGDCFTAAIQRLAQGE